MNSKLRPWGALAPIAGLWLVAWGLFLDPVPGQSLLDPLLEKTPVARGDPRAAVDPELRKRFDLLMARSMKKLSRIQERDLANAIYELGPEILTILSCEVGAPDGGPFAPPGSRSEVRLL
jgi:hypothetical protein